VVCLGNEFLHPWTLNLKKLARKISLPFLPISPLMFIFLLFPSMGVWAMRTRLRYYIQPLDKPWMAAESESEKTPGNDTSGEGAVLTVCQVRLASPCRDATRFSSPKGCTSPPIKRSQAYRHAQQLREKLQNQIYQLLKPDV
jgi:hypothetical protein